MVKGTEFMNLLKQSGRRRTIRTKTDIQNIKLRLAQKRRALMRKLVVFREQVPNKYCGRTLVIIHTGK